jgi:hypothetical protein
MLGLVVTWMDDRLRTACALSKFFIYVSDAGNARMANKTGDVDLIIDY